MYLEIVICVNTLINIVIAFILYVRVQGSSKNKGRSLNRTLITYNYMTLDELTLWTSISSSEKHG